MSTDFITLDPNSSALKQIDAHELFDGRLKSFGIEEPIDLTPKDPGLRYLRDRCGHGLHVWISRNGKIDSFTSYGGSLPERILEAIEELFEVRIVSEHEPEYLDLMMADEEEGSASATSEGR